MSRTTLAHIINIATEHTERTPREPEYQVTQLEGDLSTIVILCQREMERMRPRGDTTEDEIADGMLRWEPGTLSTTTMDRVLMDVLADIWQDCYRRGDTDNVQRAARFNKRVGAGLVAVLGSGATTITPQ